MRTAILTLLITKDCPLACRYCNLKKEMSGQGIDMTIDDIRERINKFLNNTKDILHHQVVFTGGEPFTKWLMLKQIIQEYGDKCSFEFNTSGVLLTEEIILFLQNYRVIWNLSVDGGRALTNYCRPFRSGGFGYFDKLKQIIPTLLYYYPNTTAKVIISRRTIDLFYQTYLEIEQLGFKNMIVVTDLTERDDSKNTNQWTNDDWFSLTQQFQQVAHQLYLSIDQRIDRLQIRGFYEILHELLNPSDISIDSLKCEVLTGRDTKSIFGDMRTNGDGACFQRLGFSKESFATHLQDSLEQINFQCPISARCPFFSYCISRCCPKDNIEITGAPYHQELAFCNLTKALGSAVLTFLTLSNERYSDDPYYHFYLNKCRGGGNNAC